MKLGAIKRFAAFGLALLLSTAPVMKVQADLRGDLAAAQQQKSQTKNKLANAEYEIDVLEDKKNKITNEINSLDAELVITLAAIETLKNEIIAKQAEIEVTEANLARAEEEREHQYELMKKRIQFLYETGGDSAWLSLILNGKDISSILNQAEYTQKLYSYDRQCLEEYMAIVQQVSDYKDQLNQEKAELEESEAEQEAQQAHLEQLLAEKRATSADYSNQIKNLNAKAAQYASLIAQQNAEIQWLQQKIAEEEEAKRRAAEEAARQEAARQEAARQEAARQEAARQQQNSNNGGGNSNNGGGNSNSGGGSSNNGGGNSNNGGCMSSTPAKPATPPPAPAPSYSGTGAAVADYACNFVGNPYVWGGTSLTNGADCSGFIMSVYAQFGVSLPHSSAAMRSCGVGVSYANAMPGDIICYDGHVAIYLGGGAIVHASNERDGIKISGNAAYRPILAVRRVI